MIVVPHAAGSNPPQHLAKCACARLRLAQSRLIRQDRHSSLLPGNTVLTTRDKFAAEIVNVRTHGKLPQWPGFITRTTKSHRVQSFHPSLSRFAGRPMMESSGRPLLLVPGKLDVRMSLSSWLTLLTGYLILESSKQLSAGLP